MPQLVYYGTKETGRAKADCRDLYPYTDEMKVAFKSAANKKLGTALEEADTALFRKKI